MKTIKKAVITSLVFELCLIIMAFLSFLLSDSKEGFLWIGGIVTALHLPGFILAGSISSSTSLAYVIGIITALIIWFVLFYSVSFMFSYRKAETEQKDSGNDGTSFQAERGSHSRLSGGHTPAND